MSESQLKPLSHAVTGVPSHDRVGVGLVAQGLCKRFGSVIALNELSLEVMPGEALGLLGPNGAGKSTLMHMLAGVTRPDRGRIEITGLGPPTRAQVRRHLGLAPQELSLYPKLTAAENLRFFARLYGVPRKHLRERVDQGLELAHLEDRRDHRAGTFSGGMMRRLNLACAVIHHPRLLLLDEPTAGVDPQSRSHLMESIAKLRSGGLTVICSTHLLEEAERLCDRVAIVDAGSVRDVDTNAGLKARHGGSTLEEVFLHLTGKELRDE